jgi:hypothetical protein
MDLGKVIFQIDKGGVTIGVRNHHERGAFLFVEASHGGFRINSLEIPVGKTDLKTISDMFLSVAKGPLQDTGFKDQQDKISLFMDFPGSPERIAQWTSSFGDAES